MVKELRFKLTDEGRSMKWFFEKYIRGQAELSYSGFANQLNGYSSLSDKVKKQIRKYMGK